VCVCVCVCVCVATKRRTLPNVRNSKRLLVAGLLDPAAELALLNLVFSKHRKAQQAWAHRQYVVTLLLARRSATAVLATELAVTARALDVYPKLYMGWTYRHWLVQRLPDAAALAAEHAWLRAWLPRHVSDHAAAHHLQGVLARRTATALPDAAPPLLAHVSSPAWLAPAAPADLPDAAAVHTLWADDAKWLAGLVITYPGHEALWAHRRFLAAASAALAPLVGPFRMRAPGWQGRAAGAVG
jgi:protein prenyltransferase alpha subunit repeat containing protein 1